MKNFKNLICLIFIAVLAYSCEPEELPDNQNMEVNDITANTDEYDGDDVTDRKGNTD